MFVVLAYPIHRTKHLNHIKFSPLQPRWIAYPVVSDRLSASETTQTDDGGWFLMGLHLMANISPSIEAIKLNAV